VPERIRSWHSALFVLKSAEIRGRTGAQHRFDFSLAAQIFLVAFSLDI
jgi:hypothetical protein